ncbi:hypothetical protein LTR53_010952 [Teratosphaeriaceae sp. CCFEE 6253]|nr:hypothetical protein LTR53_010952 [Teratosphaeriaceae sp. CCFEE 6253]
MAAAAVQSNWAYAVPMDETSGHAQPQRTDTLRSQTSTTSVYREKRSASQRRTSDFNVQSDTEATGTRKASQRASNAAASRKRSRNGLREMPVKEASVDDSAWIHRDKLAAIEIQEMEDAGIHVRQSRRSGSTGPDASARTSRSASRSGVRRPMSKDRHSELGVEEQDGPLYENFDDFQRKRVSTIPAADEEEYEQERRFDPELRTPEEVAAEQQAPRQLHIRPSTSRIPISKVSPVPVPQQVVDRDSPLPRSRNGSGAWSGAWDDMQYARRARSGSAGSQVMVDEEDRTRTPTSRPTSSHLRSAVENSPPKARIPGKAAPLAGGRKSASSNGTRPLSSHANKPRTSSLANKRPGSGSGPAHGHKSRPSTGGHAPPEGEAPWIASMYKPDPRLPPDQQLLPTHAKRLQQEQWEKEGKTGIAYDRDLNLLHELQFQETPAPVPKLETARANGNLTPRDSPRADKASPSGSHNGDKPWPLSPQKSDTRSETGSLRPGTSGGYKITPTIAATPPIQRSPIIGSTGHDSAVAPFNATPRMPDSDDEKELSRAEKKKGCGCCIVM